MSVVRYLESVPKLLDGRFGGLLVGRFKVTLKTKRYVVIQKTLREFMFLDYEAKSQEVATYCRSFI